MDNNEVDRLIKIENRLIKIETQIDIILEQHDKRINRLENGLVGTGITLLLAIAGSIITFFFSKK